MNINEKYKIFSSNEDKEVVEYLKANTLPIWTDDLVNRDIDNLIVRVAVNMFYYEDNIATAKVDYFHLMTLLVKKGVVFETVTKANEKTLPEEKLTLKPKMRYFLIGALFYDKERSYDFFPQLILMESESFPTQEAAKTNAEKYSFSKCVGITSIVEISEEDMLDFTNKK